MKIQRWLWKQVRQIFRGEYDQDMSLLLKRRRMVITGGRGVGKSETAVSLAVGALCRERSVVYVAMNDQHAKQIVADNPMLRGKVHAHFGFSLKGLHPDYLIVDRPFSACHVYDLLSLCRHLVIVEN